MAIPQTNQLVARGCCDDGDFFGFGGRDEERDQDSSYGEDEDYSRY